MDAALVKEGVNRIVCGVVGHEWVTVEENLRWIDRSCARCGAQETKLLPYQLTAEEEAQYKQYKQEFIVAMDGQHKATQQERG